MVVSSARQLHDLLVMPLVPLVDSLGMRGLPFCEATRNRLVRETEVRIAGLDVALGLAGLTKPNSPFVTSRQLRELGVPLTTRTEKGVQFKTDLDVLRRLNYHYNQVDDEPRFPFLAPLIMRRKLEKARSILQSFHACNDGRLRTSLRSTGTSTGRYSSSRLKWCDHCQKPNHGTNLQNIPRNAEEIELNVKACFRARPGYMIGELDYMALELRVMAYLAGVTRLIERFERGADLHAEHARAMFGEGTEVTKTRRTLAKNFFYALRGGGGARAIQIALAKQGEFLEQVEIEALGARLLKLYPEMATWQFKTARVLQEARDAGRPQVSYNAFGRPRVLLAGDDVLKDALANEIQGTAAGIIDFALLRLSHDGKLPSSLCMQGHDSFVLEAPEHLIELRMRDYKEEMERPVWLAGRFAAFPVEAKVGESWDALKEVVL